VEAVNRALAESGAVQPAAEMQASLRDILRERGVPAEVVDKVDDQAKAYTAGAKSRTSGKKPRPNGGRPAPKRRD
jgi:hypothetical protein